MSFRWEAYLDLAQHLAVGLGTPPAREANNDVEQIAAPPEPSEAALRTAVSRAYYSAYHLAREYVVSNNLGSVGRLESHQDVWRAFEPVPGKPRPRKEMRIGAEGGILHRMRKNADYEIDPPSWSGGAATPEARQSKWKQEAKLAVERAGIIAKLLGDLALRN